MDTVIALAAGVLLLIFVYYAVGQIRTSRSGTASIGDRFRSARSGATTRKEKVYPARRNPYRATSIVNERNPCPAVKKLLNIRFLDLDKRIPSLPVAGCNMGHCDCKYVHHDERREEGGDRRAPMALTSDLYAQSGHEDRRTERGSRRKSDFTNRQIQYSEFDR
jgi:hypothetical protein